MKQQIAIYLRLSLEDVDKRTNKVKDESNSIASQRMLINRHLDQNPLLCDLPRIEFCDDGFSGTNFDRPDFAKMIECAKHGEISCIVVKDLSRFGRDYLEVGDYLEHISRFSVSASSLSMTIMTARNMKARLSVWILPSRTLSMTITAKTCPRRSSLQWE